MEERRAKLIAVLRWGLGLTLLLAALGKSGDVRGFAATLGGSVPVAVVVLLAEVAVALGLFRAGTARIGGAAVGLLSLGFLSRTVPKALARVPEGCHCFGALFEMTAAQAVALDVVLLVAGALVAVGCRGAAPAPAPRPSPPLPLRQVACVSVAWCGLLVLLTLAGQARHRGLLHTLASRQLHVKLHEGDVAPEPVLRTVDGRPLDPSVWRGRWSLLVFTSAACRACDGQTRDLGAALAAWGRDLPVVVVERPRRRASALLRPAEPLPRGMTRAVDPDGAAFGHYVDQDGDYPFSVLLDPDHVVRWVTTGYDPGPSGLVGQVSAWLAARPVTGGTSPQPQLALCRPAVDTPLFVGRSERLSATASRQPTLVSVVSLACDACQAHVAEIERLVAQRPEVARIYGVLDAADVPRLAARVRPGASLGLASPELRARYGGALPSATLIVEGRIAWHTGLRTASGALAACFVQPGLRPPSAWQLPPSLPRASGATAQSPSARRQVTSSTAGDEA